MNNMNRKGFLSQLLCPPSNYRGPTTQKRSSSCSHSRSTTTVMVKRWAFLTSASPNREELLGALRQARLLEEELLAEWTVDDD